MSKEEDLKKHLKNVSRIIQFSTWTLIFILFFLPFSLIFPNFLKFKSQPEATINIPIEINENRIENGIHLRTGLIDSEGLMTVVNNCTNCHSAKIIIQNRMNTEEWNSTIKWMQETQNLWNLGKNQEIIVNYLVENYPQKGKERRKILSDIDWYELKN